MKNLKTFESFINEYHVGDVQIEGEASIPDSELPILLNTDAEKTEVEEAAKNYLNVLFESENAIVSVDNISMSEHPDDFAYFNVTLSGTQGELIKVAGDDKIVFYEW